MKKGLISKFFILLLVVGLLFAVAPTKQAQAQTADVSWYSDGPESFTLSDADDLAGLAQLVNAGNTFSGKTILLGADIDLLAYTNWDPIGGGFGGVDNRPFDGIFDGQSHTIANLTINRPTEFEVGLFGTVGVGTVQNFALNDVNIIGLEAVGGVAGRLYPDGTVNNVTVQDATITGNHWAGGIAGFVYGQLSDVHVIDVTISSPYLNDDQDGDKGGGLVGYMADSQLSDCSATTVTVTAVRNAGGLVGAAGNTTITNCSVDGATVTASNATGSHASPYAGGALGQASGAVTLTTISVTDPIVSSYDPAFAGTVVGGPLSNVTSSGVELTLNVGVGQAYATLADAMAVVPTGLAEITYALHDDQTFTTTGHGTPDLAKGADVVNLIKAPTVTGEVKLTLAGVYYGTLNAIDAQFNVEGLTLINGRDKSGEGPDPWEFAYFEPDSASVTFKDCKFNHGVMVSIDATFDNCLFSRQSLTFPPDTTDYSLNDYALWIHNFGDVVVKNSTFENFEYGGVKSTWNMYATGADLSLTLQDNTFVNIGNGGEHTIANLDGAVSVTITRNLVIDSYLGSTTDEQAALLEVDPIDPAPTITVNTNIWAIPSVLYVDDSWAAIPFGEDPDVTGPATAMGYDAFATIQEGIAAVGAGGTVNVAAGLYEGPLTIDKQLSLLGPNATINPNTASRNPEAVVVYPSGLTTDADLVTVTADGVLIDGFTFDGKDLGDTLWGEGVFAEANNLSVKNNIIKNLMQIGIRIYSNIAGPYYSGALIENNKVISDVAGRYFSYSGIYLQGTHGVVRGNVVDDAYRGIQIQPYNHPSTELGIVENNTFSAYKSPIYFNYSSAANGNWVFRRNIATGIASPEASPVDYFGGITVQTFGGGNVLFDKNQITLGATDATLQYLYYEIGTVVGTSSATPNWWGSVAGPAAGTIVGNATYVPWCGDEDCSFLVYPMVGTDLQASIDATPAGGTLYVPAGTYSDATGGSYGYDVGGITLILGDGVVIANPGDSCFSIVGSHTRILAENIGMAKCVPNGYDVSANSYSHGIVIDPSYIGIEDIVIDGLEFDGSETNSGSGIYSMGYVTDIQILNNYMHDLFWGTPSTAIDAYNGFSGLVQIQGNLFKDTWGISDFTSSSVPAEHNSWGKFTVNQADVDYLCVPDNPSNPTVPAYCGVTDLVQYVPYTHAAIELRSTNPTVDNWANQVFVDDEITYQVVGVFQNITAADFTLTYDPTKLDVVSITPVTGIFQSADGDLVDELVEGQIRYDGVTYPGFTSADADGTVLYTVTFKPLGAGDADLVIDPATDLFGMIPPSGPSTNVYAAELDSVTVHKIDRPTLTPTNLDGLYVVGVSHEISTVITNPATGGVWTESPTEPDAIGWIRISNADVADITQLQFKYTDGVWYDFSVQDQYGGVAVQQDNEDVIARFGNYNFGFDMPNDWDDVDAFRVTFAEAGTHTVTIGIYDMMDTAENFYGTDDILLTEITQEITVYDPPTVSSDDIQGYYLTGEERIFNVSMDNPDDGANYALLIFDYTLEGVTPADITSFEYYAQDLNQWIDMGSRDYETYYDCTVGGVASICGQFGWAPGGFGPIAAGFENTSQFRINFANSFSAPLDFTLDLSGKLLEGDADWTPLTTFTGSLEVFDPATVTVTGDPYYIVGEAGNFQVEIVNPLSGRDYGDEIVFDIVIGDIPVNGISAFSCTMDGFTWTNLLGLFQYTNPGATARLVGENGYFTVEAGDALTVDCSITYASAGTFQGSGHMVDVYDKVTSAERIVSVDYSETAIVYTAPVITAAFPAGPYAAGVPVTVPVSITNPDGIPGPFELTLDLPAGTTFTFGDLTYLCGTEGCPAIPLTSLPITGSDLVITFAESFNGSVAFTLTDTTWDPDRVLATLTQTGVIVGGDYGVTGTFSMQGRTKRAGVEVTFTWDGGTYSVTATTIEQISNNLAAILKYGGDYTITVSQARYLDITTAHGATINPATALSLVLDSLELRAGDADDDNDVDLDDATIVGGLYGTGTIADRGDINFDNRVNIQDLALIGGNYELQSTTPTAAYYAYGDWMQ